MSGRLSVAELPLELVSSHRWNAAVLGALRLGLVHDPACAGRPRRARPVLTPGCPWCEHVRANAGGALTNGKAPA